MEVEARTCKSRLHLVSLCKCCLGHHNVLYKMYGVYVGRRTWYAGPGKRSSSPRPEITRGKEPPSLASTRPHRMDPSAHALLEIRVPQGFLKC